MADFLETITHKKQSNQVTYVVEAGTWKGGGAF